MNYRNLRDCRLQVSHLMSYHVAIYRHGMHLCIILMHAFARKQCIFCSALRHESYLTLPYVIYRLEIHSALERSRTVLLCYCPRRETARWQFHPGI